MKFKYLQLVLQGNKNENSTEYLKYNTATYELLMIVK